MNTIYICLLALGLMPIVCAGVAKWGFKNYDNNNPRRWLQEQEGFRARANSAQANCFEAFPLFSVSVACAVYAGTSVQLVSAVTVIYLALRVLYVVLYLANLATMRTSVWCAALVCVLLNFYSAIAHPLIV